MTGPFTVVRNLFDRHPKPPPTKVITYSEQIVAKLQQCFKSYQIQISTPQVLRGRVLQFTRQQSGPTMNYISLDLRIADIVLTNDGLQFETIDIHEFDPESKENRMTHILKWNETSKRWFIDFCETLTEGEVVLLGRIFK